MSEILATSPALPGEAATVEGRLADIMAGADCEVRVSDYRLSDSDKAKVVTALRAYAPPSKQPDFRAQVFRAAERTNQRYGQWMPQQWLEIFVGEMMKEPE